MAPHQDIESLSISAGRNHAVTRLFGVTPPYAEIYNQSAGSGRLLSAADIDFGRSVMVLGTVPAAKLFPGRSPIGETVRVGSHEFEVIGVQARKGKLSGESLDNRIYVPLPVVLRVLLGGTTTKSVGVRVHSETEIEATMDAITELLRRQHNLPASYADDFSTEDQAEFVKEAQKATGTFRLLTFALGGIALLVGGIGIMNMMLVSVRERTREIGIRKSVGADPRAVQTQFLIEAVVLSTSGGVAGLLAGIVTTRLIGTFAGWQTLDRAAFARARVRRGGVGRALLRLLPRTTRGAARSDRGAPLRVGPHHTSETLVDAACVAVSDSTTGSSTPAMR